MENINPLKHTPGPWEVALYKSCVWIRETEDRKRHPYLADVFSNEQWPEGKANANLIAAAPELLAACKAALVSIQGANDMLERKLNDAIKRADPFFSRAIDT